MCCISRGSFMRLKKVVAIVVVIALIVGAVFLVLHHKEKPIWKSVKQAPVVSAIYGLGTVEANRSFNLASGVTNYIRKFYVDLGESVKKNQVLVSYLDGHSVRSPFDGVVTAKMSNVNEVISPQTNVLTVTDLSDPYLLVSLDQDSLLKLDNVKQVRINFEALPNDVFTGTVTAIYSHDSNFYIRIAPKGLSKKILPGMTADVALVTHNKENSLLIPLSSIKQGKVIYRVGKQVSTVQVQIGAQDNGWGQVVSNNIPDNAQVRVN